MAPPWPWIARVALLPIMVLAIGPLWVVGAGLWNGEIHAISKGSNGMVSRLTSAVGYWFAVAYHSFVATFIAYFAMQVLRFSLPRKQPK